MTDTNPEQKKTKPRLPKGVSEAQINKLVQNVISKLQARDAEHAKAAKEIEQKLLSLGLTAHTAFVLVVAADLENTLEDLIKIKMPNLDKKLQEKIFEGGLGPLRSFSSKIDISYAFGIIDAGLHKDLHAVRDIRNRFAHTRVRLHFDEKAIGDLFPKFNGYTHKANRREFFIDKTDNLRNALMVIATNLAAVKAVPSEDAAET